MTVRREKTPFLQEEISSRTRLRAGWPSAMTGLGEGRKTGQKHAVEESLRRSFVTFTKAVSELWRALKPE